MKLESSSVQFDDAPLRQILRSRAHSMNQADGIRSHAVFALARKSTFQPFPVGFPVISSHFQAIDRLENWLGTFSSRIFSGQIWRGLPFKFGRMTHWKDFLTVNFRKRE
jgi:hypothetical protein